MLQQTIAGRVQLAKELNGFYCEKANAESVACVVSSNLETVPFGFVVTKINGLSTTAMTIKALRAVMQTRLLSYEAMSEGLYDSLTRFHMY